MGQALSGIVNVDKGMYLSSGSSYSDNRTNVGLSSGSAVWWVLKGKDGSFRIRHGGDLYAASDGFKFDDERRRLFIWGQDESVAQGYWRFEKVANGEFLIKNTYHNEYLYAADYPDSCSVFTWSGGHLDYARNSKFRWKLYDLENNLLEVPYPKNG